MCVCMFVVCVRVYVYIYICICTYIQYICMYMLYTVFHLFWPN